ncbi:ASST-domain-containing protein [Dactylonectria estremocensis]|uniref:ASST-domain-containing protein n=1 Tax=Dactylonectria estremocensis TaxID=1079267 RepID=A0A9P9DWZ9_9HYPO|nr:ASST-domain-containing protein [Dactylonectria estremocensis]
MQIAALFIHRMRANFLYSDSSFPLDSGKGIPGSGRNQTDAWNYFHINSVEKDDEGNYLISARNIAAVFKVDGTSGKVIWQFGVLHVGSSFQLSEKDRFAFQHHAQFRGRSSDGNSEIIPPFDNGTLTTLAFSWCRFFLHAGTNFFSISSFYSYENKIWQSSMLNVDAFNSILPWRPRIAPRSRANYSSVGSCVGYLMKIARDAGQ